MIILNFPEHLDPVRGGWLPDGQLPAARPGGLPVLPSFPGDPLPKVPGHPAAGRVDLPQCHERAHPPQGAGLPPQAAKHLRHLSEVGGWVGEGLNQSENDSSRCLCNSWGYLSWKCCIFFMLLLYILFICLFVLAFWKEWVCVKVLSWMRMDMPMFQDTCCMWVWVCMCVNMWCVFVYACAIVGGVVCVVISMAESLGLFDLIFPFPSNYWYSTLSYCWNFSSL